jgi:hypothetical protein
MNPQAFARCRAALLAIGFSFLSVGMSANAQTPFTLTLSSLVNGASVTEKTFTPVFAPASPGYATAPAAFTQVGGLTSGATAGATGYANWTGWQDTTRYFYYSVTAGASYNLVITEINSNLRSSNTGPRAVAVETSSSLSGPWDLRTTSNLINANDTAVNAIGLNILVPAGTTLFIRYRNTSSVSANGGTVGSTGTHRINSGSVVGAFVSSNPNAPQVTGFSPAAGVVGTPVAVSGTNFTGLTGVTFGSVSASVVSSSATNIQTTVPPGAITAPITVATPNGTNSSAQSFIILDGSGTATAQNGTAPYTGKNIFPRATAGQTLQVVYTPPSSGTIEGLRIEVPSAFGAPLVGNVSVSGGGGSPSASVSGQFVTISGLAATSAGNVTVSISGLSMPDTSTPVTTTGANAVNVQSRGSGGTFASIAAQPSALVTVPLANVRNYDTNFSPVLSNTLVAVQGTASVPKLANRGISSAIQDSTWGVALDATTNVVISNLVRGNNYAAIGRVSQFSGLVQISITNAADILDLGAGTDPVPVTATVSQFTNTNTAPTFQSRVTRIENLNKLSGTWATTNSVVLTNTAGDQVTVFIPFNSTATTEPAYPVNVTGVGGQFDNTSPFNTGFQLQPRDPADLTSATLPSISVNPTSISNLTATQGSFGPSTNFVVNASNLSNNVTVTATDSNNFAISTNASSGFTNALSLLTNSSGAVTNASVFVRLTGAAPAGAKSNTVSLVSGSVSTNVSVSGTVAPPPAPTLTAAPTNLSGLQTIQGSASPAPYDSYALSGTTITNSVTIAAPTGLEVSFASNGLGFSNSLLIPSPLPGNTFTTNVFVRIASGASVGSFTNSITNSTIGGTSNALVQVSGQVLAAGTPLIEPANNTALSGFTTVRPNPSTNQQVTVFGTNLTAPITITPPEGWQISATNTNNFVSSPVILATNPAQVVSNTLLYIRLAGTNASATNYPSSVLSLVSDSVTNNILLSGTVNNPGPSVSADPTSLSSFSTPLNMPSAFQPFTAFGTNLTSNITVTAPTGVAISFTNNNTGVGTSLTITNPNPAGGATNRIVFVRLTGAAVGNFSNNVTLVSGSGSNSVAVVGEVLAPSITVSATNLPAFNSTTNVASTAQSFFAQGTNLSANIAVTAPTGFSVAFTTNNADFTNSITLTNSGSIATNREIFVRMNASLVTNSLGPTNVVLSSLGATNRTVSVSGNITAAQPSLAATPPSLSSFSTVAGIASAAQSYTLSGSNLGAVTVTAPPGFEVALTNTNSAFAGSVLPAVASGNLNTNIWVRVSAGAATNTNLTGNIANSSGTASTNVSLQARVVPAPTLSAVPTALSNFSTITGIASTNQPFALNASNLLGPVNLSVTNGYEISFATNSGFSTTLTVALTNASDNASNYSGGWTNGANGGTGFGPWSLPGGTGGAGGFNGAIIGAATNTLSNYAPLYTGGVAFSIYAGGSGSAFQDADRNLERPLAVGETLTHSFGIAFDNGNKGFDLYDGTNQVFNFNVNSSGYSWTGGNTAPPTPYPTNREFGAVINFSFTRTTNGFTYAISSPQDSNLTRNGSLTNGGIDRLKYYISGAGGGDPGNIYFNNFQVAYTGGNISNLPVYVRLATNAPIAEATNSLLSRVTISSTAVPQSSVMASAASSQTYNAYNDFYFSPSAAGWTGATNPSTTGAAWGYYMGNVNGNGGFPLNVGSYLTSGQLYKLSSVGPLSSDPTKYSTSLWDNTGGAGFARYQANIPGWSTSLGSFSTPWFDGAPGFGTSLSNAIWMQSSYLANTQPSPAGPAEGIASVLTWTAPMAGSYSFSGRFVAGNQPGNSAAVSIVDSLGGTNLARTILSNNSTQSISFTKSYNAGDTVQFQVGNHFSTGNAVGLQVNVAPATESSNVFAYVDLSGRVEDRPSITVVPNALANLLATNGFAGAATNFLVSGRNLTNDIVLSVAPTNSYQISTNSVAGFTNTITLARSNGVVSTNTIFVRIASTAPLSTNANSLTGNVTLVSLSALTNVTLSGRVLNDPNIPSILTSTNALRDLGSVEGLDGDSTNFMVSGSFLRGSINVATTNNFLAISTNNASFVTNISLPRDENGNVLSTPVYVRISKSAPVSTNTNVFLGNVVLSTVTNSNNLPAPTNVAVFGTVTNWSIANPYGIRVTNPVDAVSTYETNFVFRGQIGTAIDRNTLSWFNLLSSQSNSFGANTNLNWSVSAPLGIGNNTFVFSGQYLAGSGTTNIASDAAGDGAYAPPGGWVSGDNGGYGFRPWQLYSEDGLSALYIADIFMPTATNMNVSAFYGFAFESIVGGAADAYRPFAAPLQAPGGSFTIYFDSNELQPQGAVGMQLVSSNKTPLFTFAAANNGSGPGYQISDATKASDNTGWAYNQDGLFLRFEMTSSNAYSFIATSSTFTNTNSGTISNVPIAGVVFFTEGAGQAPGGNFYVGKMQQDSTIYEFATATTVAPDVERTDAPPPSAYNLWAQGYGLDPAGNGAPTADPDNDGFANDMEFAFGTSPVQANGTLLTVSQSGGNMVVTFLARTSSAAYAVMQKANLAAILPAWADTGIVPAAASDQNGVPQNYERRFFSVPVTGQNFYRVRATFSQ